MRTSSLTSITLVAGAPEADDDAAPHCAHAARRGAPTLDRGPIAHRLFILYTLYLIEVRSRIASRAARAGCTAAGGGPRRDITINGDCAVGPTSVRAFLDSNVHGIVATHERIVDVARNGVGATVPRRFNKPLVRVFVSAKSRSARPARSEASRHRRHAAQTRRDRTRAAASMVAHSSRRRTRAKVHN